MIYPNRKIRGALKAALTKNIALGYVAIATSYTALYTRIKTGTIKFDIPNTEVNLPKKEK